MTLASFAAVALTAALDLMGGLGGVAGRALVGGLGGVAGRALVVGLGSVAGRALLTCSGWQQDFASNLNFTERDIFLKEKSCYSTFTRFSHGRWLEFSRFSVTLTFRETSSVSPSGIVPSCQGPSSFHVVGLRSLPKVSVRFEPSPTSS